MLGLRLEVEAGLVWACEDSRASGDEVFDLPEAALRYGGGRVRRPRELPLVDPYQPTYLPTCWQQRNREGEIQRKIYELGK